MEIEFDESKYLNPMPRNTREERLARRIRNHAIRDLLESDIEKAFGFAHLPDGVKNAIHLHAWESGHSSGYAAVWCESADLAELCVAAFNAGKAAK